MYVPITLRRVDGFGRPVVRVPIPARDGDKPISIDCFCATYTIENLPAEITEGTEVFLYRDGQVGSHKYL